MTDCKHTKLKYCAETDKIVCLECGKDWGNHPQISYKFSPPSDEKWTPYKKYTPDFPNNITC